MEQKNSISKYPFAFFALFIIFSDEIFYSLISFIGVQVESGMKSREAIVIAAISYLLLVFDYLKHRLSNRNMSQLFALLMILVLYYLTHFIYPASSSIEKYWSNLLLYGSMCIPACYIGIRLSRVDYSDEVGKLLPLFIIMVSVFVGRAAFSSSLQGMILGQDEDDVIRYQSASYFLAFSFSYSFYYLFFRPKTKKRLIDKILLVTIIASAIVCLVGCLVAGGRGGFVYLVLIVVFLLYRLISRRGKRRTTYLLFVVVAGLLSIFVIRQFHVLDSSGFERVSSSLTEDSERRGLWNMAIEAFFESPIIGNGLGSIWWKVGFYSHNILSDLLAESGILGTSIVICVLMGMLNNLLRWSKVNCFDLFVLIVLFGTLVHDTFSGYWLSSYKLFFVFGYVYDKKYRLSK